jgi:hypothetical protein
LSEYDTISKSDHSECRALLDACTPLVYVHNAFRISGLAVDASARDIKRRIDDLKHAEELGDAEAEHTHAFALEPPPTLEHIREAARRLQDPERRIIEEFFWFWPIEWGGGRADHSLTALSNGDKDTAFKTWSSALSNGNGASPVVAKHNLAVMYQLVALDSEQLALEDDLSPDQHQTIAKYWRTSFKWWEDLTADEMFWSLISDRIRMMDDPRLTTGFARRMRTTFPEALDKINAMLAVAFFEKGKLDLGRNHVTYMLETHQGLDDVPKTLAIVTKPLKTRVESSVEKARTAAQRAPKKAAQGAHDLLNAVAEPIKIIQMILPSSDHERIDLCDSVAETCLTCQIAFARETKDWAASLQLLDSAKVYAASQETKARIEENRITVANNRLFAQYLDPLAAAIQKADTHSSVSAKLKAIESDVVPRLRALDQQTGITAEVREACADLVARYVRGLSVTAYNETKDIELALKAHEVAKSLAQSADLRKQISDDAKQLTDIRISEMCWFCKTNRATEASKLDVPMHGEVQKNWTLGGTRVTWKKLTATVPRCEMCKKAHDRSSNAGCVSAIIGAAVGSIAFPVGTIVGGFVGWGIGAIIGAATRPASTAGEGAKADYPPIKELRSQGWELGEKPSGVN